MSALQDAKNELAEYLRTWSYTVDNVQVSPKVFPYVPKQYSPPLICISPSTPYFDFEATSFARERNVHWDVTLVVPMRNNETADRDLDAMLDGIFELLISRSAPSRYGVERVSQPFNLKVEGQDQPHLAVQITVTTTI
jgi:hypothetical protein